MEERLQPRIAAGLLDLLLLAGLFTILGLTIGETSWADRALSFTLSNEQLLLFLALAFAYHFALEATTGQTVGKRLLALRVVRARGGRPSPWAVAVRTALRVVDILPFAYVVGFVTMIATRDRRQRLGDLAARTVVVRAPRPRRRSLALAPLVLVLLAVGGLIAYRADSIWGTKTYRAHGISFDHPADWRDPGSEWSFSGEGVLWIAAVRGRPYDLVAVHGVGLRSPVTAQNLAAAKASTEEAVRAQEERQGVVLQAGSEEITVGWMPGFRLRGTQTMDRAPVVRTIVVVFGAATAYWFDCLHLQGSTEGEQACALMLRTFAVDRPGPAPIAAGTTAQTPTPTPPTPTGPRPLTAKEKTWLASMPAFLNRVDRAFGQDSLYVTPRKLRELAALYRGCRRELVRGLPSERLRAVYRLAVRACAEFENGARCFLAAAPIDSPLEGSEADRVQTRAIDCGFAAEAKGGRWLADAINEGEEVKIAAGD